MALRSKPYNGSGDSSWGAPQIVPVCLQYKQDRNNGEEIAGQIFGFSFDKIVQKMRIWGCPGAGNGRSGRPMTGLASRTGRTR